MHLPLSSNGNCFEGTSADERPCYEKSMQERVAAISKQRAATERARLDEILNEFRSKDDFATVAPDWDHVRMYAPRVRVALTAPERNRRKRLRRQAGLRSYRVVLDEAALEETLRRARALPKRNSKIESWSRPNCRTRWRCGSIAGFG